MTPNRINELLAADVADAPALSYLGRVGGFAIWTGPNAARRQIDFDRAGCVVASGNVTLSELLGTVAHAPAHVLPDATSAGDDEPAPAVWPDFCRLGGQVIPGEPPPLARAPLADYSPMRWQPGGVHPPIAPLLDWVRRLDFLPADGWKKGRRVTHYPRTTVVDMATRSVAVSHGTTVGEMMEHVRQAIDAHGEDGGGR